MNIVFMGTPDFAVPCLQALIESPHNVAAVFSQPDKPVGRRQTLTAPPVKQLAESIGIPVYQPTSLKNNDEVLQTLADIAPDIIVVVAYGKLLPREILQLPRLGCVNIHASLLPKYRGAAPIQWSIVCGEQTTGVSSMLLDEGMDTGDVLLRESIAIESEDNALTLSDKLSALGAALLLKTLTGLEDGSVTPMPQDASAASYAPILQKTDGLIDWSYTAREIECKIRGLLAWPTAYTIADGRRLKIFAAEVTDGIGRPCGSISTSDNELIVACSENTALRLLELQLEGGKRMSTAELLRGRRLNIERF